MKHKTTTSIAVALIVLLSVATFVPSSLAQQPQKSRFDTGVVTLGPNQILRITVDPQDPTGTVFVRFRRIGYAQESCTLEGVCKLSSFHTYDTEMLALKSGEATSFDISSAFLGGVFVGVRGIVLTNNKDVQVNASIINTVTGNVDAVVIGLLIP